MNSNTGIVNSTGYVTSDYLNYKQCGSYKTLWGYWSGYTTSREIYYSSPSMTNPNYYALVMKVRILFIDHWESSAGIYFREGSQSAYPFHVYHYDNKGAIG